MNPLNWLEYEILGNSLLSWGTSAVIFLGTWLVLSIVRRMARHRLRKLASEHDAAAPLQIAEHAVRKTQGWFLFLMALFVGSQLLVSTPRVGEILGQTAIIGLLIQLGLWATAVFEKSLSLRRTRQLTEDPSAVATMDVVSFVLRVAIWSIILLLALDNLGVNITALIAGLGVGGIAVALAAQNILGDLFASLSIVLDKPFVVGDFLVIDEYLGSVEKVGLKTTRMRSLSGEQLVFSNNDLLSSRIRNYGRMFERRVVFSVGVTYQTSVDQVREVPGIIREAIEANRNVRFDRAHFQKFGDFALIFEVVYYVLSRDYNLYMDIQQAVNLTILERFADRRIEFAYPTQTLYVSKAE